MCTTMPGLCGVMDETQGSVYVRQVPHKNYTQTHFSVFRMTLLGAGEMT